MAQKETDIQWALRFAATLCDIDPAYDALFIRIYDEAARGGKDDAVARHRNRLIHRDQTAIACKTCCN